MPWGNSAGSTINAGARDDRPPATNLLLAEDLVSLPAELEITTAMLPELLNQKPTSSDAKQPSDELPRTGQAQVS